ncbi:MAG: alpha/beta hydrolase family protein [bacterium]
MSERTLVFTAEDGGALKASWRSPEGVGPFPAILCVHGLTLTRAQFESFSGTLVARGLACFRMDLRGHGESEGRLQDQGFEAQCSDVRKGVEALAGLPGVDPGRMGLLGFSMGGAMAARVAQVVSVKALALWSPLLKTSLWSGKRHDEFGAPKDGLRPIWDGLWVNERLFTEAMADEPLGVALAWPGPLLVCHGGKDKNHPQSASLELAQGRVAAKLSVASYFPPDSGHAWHPDGDRHLRDELSAAFFSAVL